MQVFPVEGYKKYSYGCFQFVYRLRRSLNDAAGSHRPTFLTNSCDQVGNFREIYNVDYIGTNFLSTSDIFQLFKTY